MPAKKQAPQSPPAPDTPPAYELEHWYQPARGKPETVWCRHQYADRGQAEGQLAYLTRVAESTDRPPPGMARPTRLRLVERRQLADVRPVLPGHPAEPPLTHTSVGWRTWRGPQPDPAPVAAGEAVELQEDPDQEEGVA